MPANFIFHLQAAKWVYSMVLFALMSFTRFTHAVISGIVNCLDDLWSYASPISLGVFSHESKERILKDHVSYGSFEWL